MDISDIELVERAVRGARPRREHRSYRWAAVMETFACGSTYATALCRRFGLDPDELIDRR